MLSAAPLEPTVRFEVELTSKDGLPIQSAEAGQEFTVNVYVIDQRPEPQGVFAAYLDLLFDEKRVTRTGDPVFGDLYPNVHASGGAATGILDEVGAVASLLAPQPGAALSKSLLFSAPFRAVSAGLVDFLTDPADQLPNSYTLLFGTNEPVETTQITFATSAFEVVPASLSNPAPPLLRSVAASTSTAVAQRSAGEELIIATLLDRGTRSILSLPPSLQLISTERSAADSRWQLISGWQLRRSLDRPAADRTPPLVETDRGWIDLPLRHEVPSSSDSDSWLFSEVYDWNHPDSDSSDRPMGRNFRLDRVMSVLEGPLASRVLSLRRSFVRIHWGAFSAEQSRERFVSLNDINRSLAEMIDISEILCAPAWRAMQASAIDATLADAGRPDEEDSQAEAAHARLIQEVEVQAMRGSSIAMEVGIATTAPRAQDVRTIPDPAVDANQVEAGPPDPVPPKALNPTSPT